MFNDPFNNIKEFYNQYICYKNKAIEKKNY